MVIFDILEIDDTAQHLVVKTHILQTETFTGFKIKGIYGVDESEIKESGTINTTEDTFLFKKEYTDGVDSALEVFNLDFTNKLIFVYVRVEVVANSYSACLPCGADKEFYVGITFDPSILYNKVMTYIKGLDNKCTTQQDFVDFILHWEGFKICAKSEHLIDAVRLFRQMFGKNNNKVCGCNGKLLT